MKKALVALALVVSTSAFADLALPTNRTNQVKVVQLKGAEAVAVASTLGGDWKPYTTLRGGPNGGFLSITYKQVRPATGQFELICFKNSHSNNPQADSISCTLKTSLDNKPVPDTTKQPRPVG